jgi:hypothetical protein
MFFFTYGYFRFSILIKFWISFIKYLIDPKFHEITNIWFIWSAAQWLRRYRLLPVYFRNIRFKLASELCFLYSSKDWMLCFSKQIGPMDFSSFVRILRPPANTEFWNVSNRWRVDCVSSYGMAVCCQKLSYPFFENYQWIHR